MVFVFIEILFKIVLFKGGVLIYAEHCIYLYTGIYIFVCVRVCVRVCVCVYVCIFKLLTVQSFKGFWRSCILNQSELDATQAAAHLRFVQSVLFIGHSRRTLWRCTSASEQVVQTDGQQQETGCPDQLSLHSLQPSDHPLSLSPSNLARAPNTCSLRSAAPYDRVLLK